MQDVPEAAKPRSGPAHSFSTLVGCSALLALTVALTLSYVWMFTLSRVVTMDEGYLMITMRAFLDGYPLYDDVFTQYGPGYYLLRLPIFTLLGLKLDHDTTRVLCMAAWMGTSVLISIGVFRATRSPLIAWFSFLQAVVHTATMANEPGHPQEIIALLLAVIFCLMAGAKESRRDWMFIAALTAVILTIKINIGVFLLIGFFLIWASKYSAQRRNLVWLGTLAATSMPFLLMGGQLAEKWALSYAFAAASAIAPISWIMLSHTIGPSWRSPVSETVLLAVFIATFATVLGATVASGSSLLGILNGILIRPLQLPDSFQMPTIYSGWIFANAVVALAVAGFILHQHRKGRDAKRMILLLKLSYAGTGSVLLVTSADAQLLYLSPWMWVVALPSGCAGSISGASDCKGIRLPILVLAAFQLLHAYPVAGSQLAWATLLMLPGYAYCLLDVIRSWRMTVGHQSPTQPSENRAPISEASPNSVLSVTVRTIVQARFVLLFALLWVYSTIWLQLPQLRPYYREMQPLNLEGSSLIRMHVANAGLHREITSYLVQNSDSFVTYPGFASFYFWTNIKPPTWINVSLWDILDDSQQTHIFNELGTHQNPRIVLTRGESLAIWKNADPLSLNAFQRMVVEDYELVGSILNCELLAPKLALAP